MSNRSTSGLSASVRSSGQAPPIDEIRNARNAARRELEIVQMRLRQTRDATDTTIEGLRARVAELTEALIAAYADDLTLVDSLLDPTPRQRRTTT